jgi:hypothetical protein
MNVTAADIEHIEMGSPEHRRTLAQFFLDSHVDYDPEHVQWPDLSESERQKLRSLPFWQEAVATENVTSHTVTAAAALETDPAIREAIALQGFEEQRHARLLLALTNYYQIKVRLPARFEPTRLEDDFLFAGFGECFDSFFAFGLFALARESGFFNARLVDVFEPVIQEEARHILFFVNWVKYRRLQLPGWQRPWFRLRCGWIILRQIASRAKTARTMGRSPGPNNASGGDNFTLNAHQDLGESVTLHELLALCLRESERRMSHYPATLPRPRLVPSMARFLYRVLPASL